MRHGLAADDQERGSHRASDERGARLSLFDDSGYLDGRCALRKLTETAAGAALAATAYH